MDLEARTGVGTGFTMGRIGIGRTCICLRFSTIIMGGFTGGMAVWAAASLFCLALSRW